MKKFFAALLISLAGMSGANALTLSEAADATYPVYNETRRVCSATAVSPTQLVTAFHCIDGVKDKDNEIAIGVEKLDDNQKVLSQAYNYVTFVRTDKKKDVAFLELKDKSMKFSTYVKTCSNSAEKLKMGDPLWAIGYPKGLEKTLTDGMFSSLVDMGKLTEDEIEGVFYKTTVPLTGGNSGGGLYRFTEGDYCYTGTATAGWPDVSFMTYFSPVESAEFIMKNLLIFERKAEGVRDGAAMKTSNLPKAGGSIDEM